MVIRTDDKMATLVLSHFVHNNSVHIFYIRTTNFCALSVRKVHLFGMLFLMGLVRPPQYPAVERSLTPTSTPWHSHRSLNISIPGY